MSFAVESKALKMLNRAEKKEGRYRKITKQPLPTELNGEVIAQGSFTIDNTITHEELSQYISEKIAELFDGTPTIRTNFQPQNLQIQYMLSKKYSQTQGYLQIYEFVEQNKKQKTS